MHALILAINRTLSFPQTELLRLIETEGVAAPAPIEQRWTSSSTANMSPAHDPASSETVRCGCTRGGFAQIILNWFTLD